MHLLLLKAIDTSNPGPQPLSHHIPSSKHTLAHSRHFFLKMNGKLKREMNPTLLWATKETKMLHVRESW